MFWYGDTRCAGIQHEDHLLAIDLTIGNVVALAASLQRHFTNIFANVLRRA